MTHLMAGSAPRSPLDATVELVRRLRPAPGDVVVVLASGVPSAPGGPGGSGASGDSRPLALALRAMGFPVLSVVPDPREAEELVGIGVEAIVGDLAAPDAVFTDVALALRKRPVCAVLIGDALSRVPDPAAFLGAARRFCQSAGDAPIALHVPNVTRLAVAAKLVTGWWDPASEGLPGEHVRHFSDRALRTTMGEHGFSPLDSEDVERRPAQERSVPLPLVLERATPLGTLLAAVREMSGPGAFVEHFVRLYAPGELRAASTEDDRSWAPFLSVLVRTQGRRWSTLQETLLCLAAQTCEDFEVLVLLHDGVEGARDAAESLVGEHHASFARRVRVVEVSGGGRCRPLNEGARAARGRYVATLDDDDLVFAHWVESMKGAAGRAPGHVVRVGVATQQVLARPGAWAGEDGYEVASRPHVDYPLEFDYIDHLRDNLTPNNGYAVPRAFVTELGQSWDESLAVLEDWDHLLRAASACGVTSVPTVAAMLRVWLNAESSKTAHSSKDWEAARQRVIEKLDGSALLLDRASASRLRSLAAGESSASADAGARCAQPRQLSGEGEVDAAQPTSARPMLTRLARRAWRELRLARRA